MLETLIYLAFTLAAIAILIRITPPGTPVVAVIGLAIALVAVLASARHGPTAIVAVLDALARLIGR